MGYRLEISEIKDKKAEYKACGGKLYGYTDETNFKSRQYLVDKGYLTGDEYWDYGCVDDIKVSAQEFREFIKLYNEDWNNSGKFKDDILNDEEIKELMKNDNDKILEWG
jgi:hypothetical protein